MICGSIERDLDHLTTTITIKITLQTKFYMFDMGQLTTLVTWWLRQPWPHTIIVSLRKPHFE